MQLRLENIISENTVLASKDRRNSEQNCMERKRQYFSAVISVGYEGRGKKTRDMYWRDLFDSLQSKLSYVLKETARAGMSVFFTTIN